MCTHFLQLNMNHTFLPPLQVAPSLCSGKVISCRENMAADLTQSFIQKYYDDLCELLDVAAIAAKLFSKKIIDFMRKQEILSKRSTQEANSTFADYLYRHANRDTLEMFLQILETDRQYPKHKDLGARMRMDWAEFLHTAEVSGHLLHAEIYICRM